jgi:hypothetical protein
MNTVNAVLDFLASWVGTIAAGAIVLILALVLRELRRGSSFRYRG